MNKKKIANIALSAVLALAVVGIGYSAYRQKIQADTVVPGYATLHLGLKITLPETESIRIKAVALPEDGSSRYYFKERDFTFTNSGVNNVEWYIRKIPAGSYKVMITSSSGSLTPESQNTYLISDQVNERLKYELYLGEPREVSSPVATESEEVEGTTSVTASPTPTSTPTSTLPTETESSTPSSSGEEANVPPVPQLPEI
jgi:hypothetical protein